MTMKLFLLVLTIAAIGFYIYIWLVQRKPKANKEKDAKKIDVNNV